MTYVYDFYEKILQLFKDENKEENNKNYFKVKKIPNPNTENKYDKFECDFYIKGEGYFQINNISDNNSRFNEQNYHGGARLVIPNNEENKCNLTDETQKNIYSFIRFLNKKEMTLTVNENKEITLDDIEEDSETKNTKLSDFIFDRKDGYLNIYLNNTNGEKKNNPDEEIKLILKDNTTVIKGITSFLEDLTNCKFTKKGKLCYVNKNLTEINELLKHYKFTFSLKYNYIGVFRKKDDINNIKFFNSKLNIILNYDNCTDDDHTLVLNKLERDRKFLTYFNLQREEFLKNPDYFKDHPTLKQLYTFKTAMEKEKEKANLKAVNKSSSESAESDSEEEPVKHKKKNKK